MAAHSQRPLPAARDPLPLTRPGADVALDALPGCGLRDVNHARQLTANGKCQKAVGDALTPRLACAHAYHGGSVSVPRLHASRPGGGPPPACVVVLPSNTVGRGEMRVFTAPSICYCSKNASLHLPAPGLALDSAREERRFENDRNRRHPVQTGRGVQDALS